MAAALIAIVDDEETVRNALHRLLRAAGFRTVTFETCSAFLALPESQRPDCIILDLHMPGMSGMELLKAMQGRDTPSPVIVITAYDEPGARDRCLRAGAAAYLRKPLDGSVLLDAIAAAQGGSREYLPQ
jgi:FixJ family two-component response regulator